MARILVMTDNPLLACALRDMAHEMGLGMMHQWHWACAKGSLPMFSASGISMEEMSLKEIPGGYWKQYDLVISAHCKQLFPPEMVRAVRCINIHPGLNPHNRGWYPQVFSILNGRPVGATIHEIDEELDHGAIIAQHEVPVHAWDTSKDVYDRVQQAEVQLLRQHLAAIIAGTYSATPPAAEGNINLKKDFNALLCINADEQMTMGQAIDRLRALTHRPYRNAYFIDPHTGKKVFVSIDLQPEA
jgi:methionyl-tRNA formyltransferase